ncbi:hypothetical protein Tco_0700306 [Tanacetum coccineum]
MANLEFCDKHNMVAYLKKPTGSEGFQEIVDFLNDSYIRYALTKNPTIYVSLIEKFWQTATVRTVDNGEQEITATVDGKEFTITEASVRRHLQLADVDGISVLPTTKFFDQLSLMGYVLTDDKLTFQKGKFSPQWRFLIHTILHCLSPKKTSWEQFSSNIATAIICLATNITFNFSKLIFDSMVKNLDTKYKYSMYPRFIQIFLDKNKRFLNPHNKKYIAPNSTPKLFINMKRGFSREHTPLFPSMIAIQAEEGKGSGHPSEPQPPPSTAQPTNEEPIPNVVSSSYQKTQTPRQALNQVTELPQTSEPIPNVADEAVYKEWDDRVERDTTTAASLDAKQASGNINRTQSTAIPNVPLPQGIGAGGSTKCQEAMGGSIAQTRSKRVPILPCDSPLPRFHTLGSDEGSMTLQELMVLCTTLSKKVESLEADLKQTKKVYGADYTKLIKKVKKLEKTVKSNQARRRAKIVVSDDEEDLEDSSKQGRMIEEIDQDAGVTLVTPTHSQEDQPEDQLGVFSAANVLADVAKDNVHTYTRRRRAVSTSSGGIITAEESVSTTGASMPVSTTGMVQEVNINIPSPVVIKDKGKGKIEESEDEQIKRTKLQQEQDRLGHEAVVRLHELDEEERQRIARVHEATQSFTEEEWENIRARVKADEELSRRLQAEEQIKYIKVDQAKMLVDLINQRKKYFTTHKVEAKRKKPMKQAQQRNYMINYIKHMGSNTLHQLKSYSFDELKELFEITMKNVNTFVPMETEDRERASELAARSSQATIIDSAKVRSSKRATEAELDHEGSKRHKTNEDSGSVQEQPEEEEK